MKIDGSFLRRQLEYHYWASSKHLDNARELSLEELHRPLGDSFGGVLKTLIHLFVSDRIWLSRVIGAPRYTMLDRGEEFDLEKLHAQWMEVHLGWTGWVGDVSDVEQLLEYSRLDGERRSQPLWQIVMHVVNHGTYHRGQLTTMFRQLNRPTVNTDLHSWYYANALPLETQT
jgi:uncharacterized damage-inducible protein DinB